MFQLFGNYISQDSFAFIRPLSDIIAHIRIIDKQKLAKRSPSQKHKNIKNKYKI